MGDFAIPLPLTAGADAGIECRTDGPTRIVLQFTEAVTLSGSNVDLSSGTCVGVTSLGNHAYEVQLSGADENACLTLTLVNVAGASSGQRLVGINQVRVVVLKGDVDASGAVNIFDLTAIRDYFDQTAVGNFRCDVNADGSINIFDLVAARDNQDASASCTLPEVPLHWQYSWDAENRLVAVAPAVPAAGDKKVVFTYDYMSRRVQKRVFAWNATLNGGAGDWETNPEVYQRFVYDGWNVVLVLDGPNRTITHKYTWGLDLSGLAGAGAQSRDREGAVPGIHGAGGIGGLLAVEAPQAAGDPLRHWYFYDGNGNVGQLLAYDATGPTVNAAPAAKYEYDPYGQLIQNAGTYAAANPFRFSTKWFDTTTGLGYWGYRYYSPRLGRWMSRDPIEEEGGRNLFGFVGNEPCAHIDPLGEFSWSWKELAFSSIGWDTSWSIPPSGQGFPIGLGGARVQIFAYFSGEYFGCCNKNSGKHEHWFSGTLGLEAYVIWGYAGKTPRWRGHGRDRNTYGPDGIKNKKRGPTNKPVGASRERSWHVDFSGVDPCPEEKWVGSLYVFVRASAGAYIGGQINIQRTWTFNDGVSGSDFDVSAHAAKGIYGVSVEIGGGGSITGYAPIPDR